MSQTSSLGNAAQTKRFFFTLQAGRGIAASFVVLFHLSTTIFAFDKFWGHDPLGKLFYFGRAGVEFFFVLSGFIILHFHWNDLNDPSRVLSYLKKRFCRIYPIYWFVLIFIIPVYFFIPAFGHGHEREAGVILSSIMLVHFSSGYTILTVAWTLYHEVMFYLVFSLLILNRRVGLFALCIWLMGSVFMLSSEEILSTNEFLRSPFDYFFSPLHLLFAIGMLACLALRRGYIKAPLLCAVAGVFAYLSVGLDEDYTHVFSNNCRSMGYGVSSALALVGFIALETQGRLRVPKVLSFLGDASYSIYLTHFVIISLLAKLFMAAGAKTHLPAIVSYLAMLLVALFVGSFTHLFVEKPLLQRISGRNKA